MFDTCQKWHKYRLTMNKTELKQHLEESGEENLLITINVKINLKLTFTKFPFPVHALTIAFRAQ